MSRVSTIELFKEDMKFSAGHFTVFSPTNRENIHGHNYNVYAAMTTEIDDLGLSYDYRFYKEKFYSLCQNLDEIILIPGNCPYIKISEDATYYYVVFNHEKMVFLKRDVKILDVANITVEELSHWFLKQILADDEELKENKIKAVTIKVFSGPGQCGSSSWVFNDFNS